MESAEKGINVADEIQLIKDKILGIIDPAVRLGALNKLQVEFDELTRWAGPYGQRGIAAREAMRFHAQPRGARPNTVTIVSHISGLTPATIRRLVASAEISE